MTRSAVFVTTDPMVRSELPSLAREGAILGQVMQANGTLDRISRELRLPRNGGYCGIDLFLFLVCYFGSDRRSGLKKFYSASLGWTQAMVAACGRASLASNSSASRMLAAVDCSVVRLLASDLLRHGCEATPIPSTTAEERLRDELNNLQWEQLLLRNKQWSYDPHTGALVCPANHQAALTTVSSTTRQGNPKLMFRVPYRNCDGCPLREACFASARPNASKMVACTVSKEAAAPLKELLGAAQMERRRLRVRTHLVHRAALRSPTLPGARRGSAPQRTASRRTSRTMDHRGGPPQASSRPPRVGTGRGRGLRPCPRGMPRAAKTPPLHRDHSAATTEASADLDRAPRSLRPSPDG